MTFRDVVKVAREHAANNEVDQALELSDFEAQELWKEVQQYHHIFPLGNHTPDEPWRALHGARLVGMQLMLTSMLTPK